MSAPGRFRGTAWSAISFVNAIPAGIGCAAAIQLPVVVELEYAPRPLGAPIEISGFDPSGEALVRATLERAHKLRRASAGYSARLAVQSQIPPGRGLKSSSAVSTALVRAAFRALRSEGTVAEVADVSAHAAVTAQVSVTGAYDDALACAGGGLVVADVRAHWQLLGIEVAPDLVAVLWIPEAQHAPMTELADRLRYVDPKCKEAVRLALRGDYLKAMTLNTEVVEHALGYDYAAHRAEAMRHGAVAAGVTGNGPTLACVVPRAQAAAVASALPRESARTLTVEFARGGTLPP